MSAITPDAECASTCCSYAYHFYWGERLWGQCGFRKRCFHHQRRFDLCYAH